MRGSLAALSSFYGHEASEDDLDAMMAEEVTGTDAKHQENSYGARQKSLESSQVEQLHEKEIRATLDWISPLVRDLGLIDTMKSIQLPKR